MKKYLVAGLMALLVGGVTAEVNDAPKNGWFIGAGLGIYSIDAEMEWSNLKYDFDSKTTGLALKGGYTFQLPENMYVDLYVFHNSFGDSELEVSKEYEMRFPKDKHVISYQQGYAANLGMHLAPKVSVYGTLGFARVYLDTDQPGYASAKGTTDFGLLYGLGVAYKLSDHLNVDVAYTINTSDADKTSAFKSFEATVSGLTVSTSYKF
ncbi:hypothetical protein CL648_02400 [bacterium]|nr:hypothetical protein [bacterium]